MSELRALSRSAAQVGTSVDLSATIGDKLDETNRLHFSHAGISAELKTLDPLPFTEDRLPHFGNFTVKVAGEVPPGRYEVRACGRNGVTNPRAFLVSPLEVQLQASVSHDAKSPTPIALNRLFLAKATPADIDYYALDIKEGQSIRIELIAQRLDSRMIGQLKLYDADGRGAGARRGADDVDPVMNLDALSAGKYTLAVHDFLFRGGAEFQYQLVAQEIESAVDLISPGAHVNGQLPRHWMTRALTIPTNDDFVGPSESPPPNTIDAPSETASWFSSDHVDSLFEFSADEGEQFGIDIVSHRIGEPTDARLIVQRLEPQSSGPPKLHDVLNVDDSQSVGDSALNLRCKDPTALFKAPATANYRLTVRDLDVGQTLSFRQHYTLRLRQPDPGFDLVAYRVYPNRDVNQSRGFASKLSRGGAEAIRVLAIRRDGWSGPIKIVAENLPEGVSANDAIIAANQNQTQMTLVASQDALAATSPIRIVGRSEDDSMTKQAAAATFVWGRGVGRDFVRSRICSSLFVSVSDKDLSPISITIGDANVPEIKKGESLKLPIKLTRREGGKASCVLRSRDLPGGVKAGDVTIAADKTDGIVELKVSSGVAAGTYSLWLQAETKIKVKQNPQLLERAQKYRAHLQTLHDDPAQAANLEAIKAAIAAADKKVEAAKGPAKEQELNVFLPTPHTTIRVVEK